MSLDLGDLVGRISLDSSGFDKTLDKLPGNLKTSGKVMAGGALLVGGAVAVALGTGLNDAINFDKSNRTVAAQLGLTATESARVGTLAGKLYADNYGESVQQVQGAIGNVMAGIRGMGDESDAVVSDMTAKVLSYSSAYGVESADAIQMVSGLLGSGLATSAQNAMDLMTGAMQSVPEALRGDMTDAITEYGPFLASIGMDGETAFGVLATAAEKGMYGIDKTGDALKEFTIRATDMSAASKVGYDAMGMSQDEMSAKLLAGGDDAATAFADIVHGLQSIEDPVAQSQAALALFGTPLEDLGVTEIPNFLGAIDPMGDAFDSVAGKADDLGDTLASGPGAGMDEFTRKGEIMLAGIMSGLLPGITAVFGYLNDHPKTLTAIAVGLGVVAAAVLVAAAAMWVMSLTPVALMFGGIVIAVGLLIAGIVLLVQNWDEVIAWIVGAWGGFVGWLVDGLNGLASWWSDLWAGMLEGVAAGWQAIMDWFAGIPAAIGEFFAAAGEWLLDAGMWLLSGLATGIALGVVAVWFFFTQLPGLILNFLIGAAVWLVQTGANLLNGLAAGIVAGYAAVSAWFAALPGNILAFLVGAAIWLLQTGTNLLNGLQSGITNGWAAVVAFFVNLPANILAFLVGFGTLLISLGTRLLNGLGTGISNGWVAITSFFTGLPGTIGALFAGAGDWLFDAGSNIVDGLMSGLKSMAGSVGKFFLDLLPGWIVGPFKTALGIASPSKVFKGFGVNIGEGLIGGLDTIQSDLDRRMADMVTVPPIDVALRLGSSAADAAGYGNGTGAQSGPAVTVDARMTIQGDVGWNREELEAETNQRQLDALALAGLGTVGI